MRSNMWKRYKAMAKQFQIVAKHKFNMSKKHWNNQRDTICWFVDSYFIYILNQ